jgi:hypothetical protein
LALIQSLPAIIEKSVEPMKRIDGIKIVQVDGITRPYVGEWCLADAFRWKWKFGRTGGRGSAGVARSHPSSTGFSMSSA